MVGSIRDQATGGKRRSRPAGPVEADTRETLSCGLDAPEPGTTTPGRRRWPSPRSRSLPSRRGPTSSCPPASPRGSTSPATASAAPPSSAGAGSPRPPPWPWTTRRALSRAQRPAVQRRRVRLPHVHLPDQAGRRAAHRRDRAALLPRPAAEQRAGERRPGWARALRHHVRPRPPRGRAVPPDRRPDRVLRRGHAGRGHAADPGPAGGRGGGLRGQRLRGRPRPRRGRALRPHRARAGPELPARAPPAHAHRGRHDHLWVGSDGARKRRGRAARRALACGAGRRAAAHGGGPRGAGPEPGPGRLVFVADRQATRSSASPPTATA